MTEAVRKLLLEWEELLWRNQDVRRGGGALPVRHQSAVKAESEVGEGLCFSPAWRWVEVGARKHSHRQTPSLAAWTCVLINQRADGHAAPTFDLRAVHLRGATPTVRSTHPASGSAVYQPPTVASKRARDGRLCVGVGRQRSLLLLSSGCICSQQTSKLWGQRLDPGPPGDHGWEQEKASWATRSARVF